MLEKSAQQPSPFIIHFTGVLWRTFT